MTKIQKRKVLGKFTPKLVAPLDTLVLLSPPHQNDGREKFKKRQLAKAITLGQLFPLIDLDSPLHDAYWDAYHCNKTVLQEGYKFKASYCNCRWCTVCNRIRMAKMINGYSIPILKLKNVQFMTLTAPNVKTNLIKEIDRIMLVWRRMYKSFKKHHKDIPLIGIRKLEVTYNPHTGFNPHFHFIIEGKETANILLEMWMKRNPTSDMKGQDIRKGDKNTMIELFKYAVKGVHKGKYYPKPLDEIYQSLRHRKTFYPFGIKKVVEENIEGIQSENVTFKGNRNEVWEWDKEAKNWVSNEGELLNDYIINGKLAEWIEDLTTNEREEPTPETSTQKWTKDIGKD